MAFRTFFHGHFWYFISSFTIVQITCIKNKFSTPYGIFPYNKHSTKTPAIPTNFNLNDFQKVLLKLFGVSIYISLLPWLESNCIWFVGADVTGEKMKFSIKNFFSKCDQIAYFQNTFFLRTPLKGYFCHSDISKYLSLL